MSKKPIKIIDLFAGIGGIRKGFETAGKKRIKVVYSNDIDHQCAVTYRANYGDSLDTRNIENVPISEIPTFDVLLGGFPCQSFSLAGKKRGFADTRGTLFFHIEKILAEKKPKAFLLENVAHLKNHDGGKTFETITTIIKEKLGYDLHVQILNSRDYGVPQNRPRIYLVGFKKKTPFKFPEPNNKKIFVKDILEKKVAPECYLSQKYFEGLERHRSRHEGKGNGFGYVVLNKNGVANTLVLGGMGKERNLIQDKIIRPWNDGLDKLQYKNIKGLRKLSLREWARVQGFPDDFDFPVSKTQAYRQIANSVSVPVIEKIAREMLKYL